jgi:hypothetical protein
MAPHLIVAALGTLGDAIPLAAGLKNADGQTYEFIVSRGVAAPLKLLVPELAATVHELPAGGARDAELEELRSCIVRCQPAAALLCNAWSAFALHVADSLRIPWLLVTPALPPSRSVIAAVESLGADELTSPSCATVRDTLAHAGLCTPAAATGYVAACLAPICGSEYQAWRRGRGLSSLPWPPAPLRLLVLASPTLLRLHPAWRAVAGGETTPSFMVATGWMPPAGPLKASHLATPPEHDTSSCSSSRRPHPVIAISFGSMTPTEGARGSTSSDCCSAVSEADKYALGPSLSTQRAWAHRISTALSAVVVLHATLSDAADSAGSSTLVGQPPAAPPVAASSSPSTAGVLTQTLLPTDLSASPIARLTLPLSQGWVSDLRPGVYEISGTLSQQSLFATCDVLLHHGGAGTTQLASFLAIPQVILACAFDQGDWAEAALAAGVAPPPLFASGATEAEILDAVSAALALKRACAVSCGHPAVADARGMLSPAQSLPGACSFGPGCASVCPLHALALSMREESAAAGAALLQHVDAFLRDQGISTLLA